jgi:hypothetical protein
MTALFGDPKANEALLEQIACEAALAAVKRIMEEFAAWDVPDAALIAGLGAKMADALVMELDGHNALPLDAPSARAVCRGLLVSLLGVLVGMATPHRLRPLSGPPA